MTCFLWNGLPADCLSESECFLWFFMSGSELQWQWSKKQGMFMQLEQRNKIRKSFVYVMCGGKIV